jgi:hypothetical protein
VAWRRIVETAGTHTPPRPQDPSPTWWLPSENEVVAFVGRDDEQKALQTWCEAEVPGGIALVTDVGGQGKTRLAQKVLADRAQEGWWTLAVARSADSDALCRLLDALTQPVVAGRRALVFIDYPEERPALA